MRDHIALTDLINLISQQPIKLMKKSAVLPCPCCGHSIFTAYVKNHKIQYKSNQMLAEDGDGIGPQQDYILTSKLIHLDGEILGGYCHTCNASYYLFDMCMTLDTIFADDGTPYWTIPEDDFIKEKSPNQTVYDVEIAGQQLGLLEKYEGLPWKNEQGTLYTFTSCLFQATESLGDVQEPMTRLCTGVFSNMEHTLINSSIISQKLKEVFVCTKIF